MGLTHAEPGKARRLARGAPQVTEAILACAIAIGGWTIGSAYVRARHADRARPPIDFGQSEYGAAVALACGHGFVDPGYTLTPALGEFLRLERDTLDCATLPARISPARPNVTQG